MKLKNPKLSAKVEKTTYHLTNLLGGNQQFGESITFDVELLSRFLTSIFSAFRG